MNPAIIISQVDASGTATMERSKPVTDPPANRLSCARSVMLNRSGSENPVWCVPEKLSGFVAAVPLTENNPTPGVASPNSSALPVGVISEEAERAQPRADVIVEGQRAALVDLPDRAKKARIADDQRQETGPRTIVGDGEGGQVK